MKIVVLIGKGLIILTLMMLAMIGKVLFAWVWAILVLVGKIKIGPRALWNDTTARRDFRIRRTEIKIAGSLLAVYIGVALFVVFLIFSSAGGFASQQPLTWLYGTIGVTGWLLMSVFGMPLGIVWREDWGDAAKQLEERYQKPVLI